MSRYLPNYTDLTMNETLMRIHEKITTTWINIIMSEFPDYICNFRKESDSKSFLCFKTGKNVLSIFGTRNFSSAADKIKSKIKINPKASDLFSTLTPIADLLKIGILFILLIAAFIKNFKARRALNKTSSEYQNQYEKNDNSGSKFRFHLYGKDRYDYDLDHDSDSDDHLTDYKAYNKINSDVSTRIISKKLIDDIEP